jgi:hypothetical protein
MTASRRHPSGVSTTHLQIVLGLLVILAFAVLAPRAAGDNPPGTTTTDQATVSAPTPDAAPRPDPAPVKTPPHHASPSTPTKHTAVPVAPPAAPPTIAPPRSVVQPTPAFVPTPAPPAAGTSALKARHAKTLPKHHPAPSSGLERPPMSPAVQAPAASTPAGYASNATRSQRSRSADSRPARTNVPRDFVVVLDAVAVLLLLLALIPEAVLQRRFVAARAVRFRPSIAATGISLLSASLILFMLNLSGPVP